MSELFGTIVQLDRCTSHTVMCADDEYDKHCVGDCQDTERCYCESYCTDEDDDDED